jgi:hypothetical protein
LTRAEQSGATPRLSALSNPLSAREIGASKSLYVTAAGAMPSLPFDSRTVLSSEMTFRWLLAAALAGLTGLLFWTSWGRRLMSLSLAGRPAAISPN